MSCRNVVSETRTKRLLIAGLVLTAAVGAVNAALPADACASSGAWTRVETMSDDDGKSVPVKVGGYVFLDTDNGLMWRKSESSGSYVQTNMDDCYGCFVKGKTAYYMTNDYPTASTKTLRRYDFTTGRSTKVKTFKSKNKSSFGLSGISAVCGGRIYLGYDSFDEWRYWTRVYDPKTKTLGKLLGNFAISSSTGRYAITQDNYRTDYSGYAISLRRFTSTGMKKVKRLTKYGCAVEAVGNKFYYSKSPDSSLKKMTLYRCDANGRHAKKLGSWSWKSKAQVHIQKITSTNCIVHEMCTSNSYLYTYKTKKMKRLDS